MKSLLDNYATGQLPNVFGLTKPGNSDLHEFVLVGRLDKDYYSKIVQILSNHCVEVRTQTGYSDDEKKQFVLHLCCNLKNIDCTKDQLLIDLRKKSFIKSAERASMKNRMFGSFLFPLSLFDKFRVVIVSSDVIPSVERRLETIYGSDVSSAFYEEGRNSALELAKNMKSLLFETNGQDTILENMKAYFKATGLGLFDFQLGKDLAVVRITFPPSADDPNLASKNSFLQGMAVGALEAINGAKMKVLQQSYDAHNRILTLSLVDQRTMASVSAMESERKQEQVVLEEKEEKEEKEEEIEKEKADATKQEKQDGTREQDEKDAESAEEEKAKNDRIIIDTLDEISGTAESFISSSNDPVMDPFATEEDLFNPL